MELTELRHKGNHAAHLEFLAFSSDGIAISTTVTAACGQQRLWHRAKRCCTSQTSAGKSLNPSDAFRI